MSHQPPEMKHYPLEIQKRLNCGNCNNEKQTPLMYAAKQSVRTRESNKRLRYLVSNGADVNRQDRRGMTALAMAVGIGPNPYWSTVDDALYLLEHGANPSIRDDAGNTALHQLAQVAIVPNIGVDREFQQTVRNMIHTVGSALVQHGADVNAQNNTDETPLHIVASKCGAYSISLLLSANADPAKKNKLGQTPLRIAEEKAASSGSGSSCNEAVGLLRNPAAATNVANGQNGVEGTASGKDGLLELIGAVGGALQILNKRAP